MSLMKMWSICDRCGFKYRRGQLRWEGTNLYVCNSCHDGAYDRVRHPQNRAARPRAELRAVPNGRPQDGDLAFLVLSEDGAYIITEDGEFLETSTPTYDIRRSIYIPG